MYRIMLSVTDKWPQSSVDYINEDDIYNHNALASCTSVKFNELFYFLLHTYIYIYHIFAMLIWSNN